MLISQKQYSGTCVIAGCYMNMCPDIRIRTASCTSIGHRKERLEHAVHQKWGGSGQRTSVWNVASEMGKNHRDIDTEKHTENHSLRS